MELSNSLEEDEEEDYEYEDDDGDGANKHKAPVDKFGWFYNVS